MFERTDFLQIADLSIKLHYDASASGELEPAYERFLAQSAVADLELLVSDDEGPVREVPRTQPTFTTEGLWTLHEEATQLRFTLQADGREARPYRVAILERAFSRGAIYTDPEVRAALPAGLTRSPLAFPLGELTMVGLLGRLGGLLVHGLGVARGDQGYLFAGHSGAGKTTLARLWQDEATVLCDDRVVVREHDGRYVLYGTPWHGEHPQVSARKVCLSGLYFLEHGLTNQLNAVHGAAAAAMLLAHAHAPHWHRGWLAAAAEFCGQLVRSVPCFRLAFVPDRRVIEVVQCVE